MRHVKIVLVLSFISPLVFSQAATARADDFVLCLGQVAKADLDAKIAYQRKLRDRIVERQPDFTELADINRDIQVLFAEMRFARLDYLLTRAPERLDGKNGISKFRNFDWTPEDLENLKAARPEYGGMMARLEVLKRKNQDHADWPEMRAFAKGEMREGGALAAMTADFIEHSAQLEQRLAGCQEN